jgi:hypothetical protein
MYLDNLSYEKLTEKAVYVAGLPFSVLEKLAYERLEMLFTLSRLAYECTWVRKAPMARGGQASG